MPRRRLSFRNFGIQITDFRSSAAKPRQNYSRQLGIEQLEDRSLLSASAPGVAHPDYVAITPHSGVSPLSTSGPTGMTPAAISQAYGFDQIGLNGAGETIAIVDAYDDPNIANDLHQFDVAFGLADPVFTKVNQTGGSTMPTADKGWATEIALDVEWSHAIAPGAHILLVEANSASFSDLLTAVDYARNATGVVAVSMSWGGGEFSGEQSYDSHFLTPAGHTGVSFFVSSGDAGAPTSYPATSPNVVSVGGTSLYLNGTSYSSEAGWSGSGGGISAYESQPSYQNGVATQSSTLRTNPDVSYDSDPNTGFPVYDSYNNGTSKPWGQWGGTSDAAPQWAALVAIADQGRANIGQASLGTSQLLSMIYSSTATGYFHDITSGTSTGSPNYSAGPGYDLVTGRGTPIANQVINYLIGPAGNPTAPAAPANFTGQAISTTQIGLSWSLSTGATSYQVYEETGTQTTPTLVGTYGATVTTATISGLSAATTYSFQVVAANSAGSNGSAWISVTTLSNTTTVPAAPANFAGQAISTTQVSLSWSLSSGATSYLVYEKTGTQSTPTLVGTYGGTTASATIGGLSAATTFSFQVVAANSAGSNGTAWISVTTLSNTNNTLQAPQNLTGKALTATTAQLSWSASTGATGYYIYELQGSTSVLLGHVSAGHSSTISVTITGLVAGSNNQFAVEAYNKKTTSALTAWVSVTQPAAVVLTAPQNVAITTTSSTTAQITWTGSAGATGYAIYWLNGTRSVLVGYVGANATSVNITGMTPGKSYQFSVEAYNDSSTASSAWVTVQMPSTASRSTYASLADLYFASLLNGFGSTTGH